MKQRIVQGLIQLANPEQFKDGSIIKFMLPDLVKTTGYTTGDVSKRAQTVLIRILHEYDDFAVRTIDSFVSRIIRTFAHDLHLPVDFEIEMDRDMMLDEAVGQLISKVGVDKELTDILVDFTESKSEDEKSWQIEKDIKKTAEFLFSEGSQHFISKLHEIPPIKLNELARDIRKIRNSYEDSIVKVAQSAKKLIIDNGIDNINFYRGASGIGGYFFKLAKGSIENPNSYVQTTITENKWIAVKADTIQQSAIHTIKDQLTMHYFECNSLMEKGSHRYALLGMIEKNIYQMGVLSAMEQEIDSIRRERKILHISEFNKRITDIILKEPVPFIYERIGEKYHNYLIDEFQDTSELQWKNLLPLIGDSLAYGRYNLIVGDGKQAIYRFRNGQVEQFMMLPSLPSNYEKEVFQETEQALITNYDPKVLKSNFRSLPEIIRFDNEFFKFISTSLDSSFQSIYTDHTQEPSSDKLGGLVSVEFLPYESRQKFDELNIQRVHQLVNDLTAKGFASSDIAILTRSNQEGSIIARFLMKQGIPVVSAEALLLAASPEVIFLITVLKYFSNPNNLVAVTGILNELIRKGKISSELIRNFPVSKNENISLEKLLASFGIDLNVKELLGLPLYDLCEEIIRIFGLNEGVYDLYLQFFLDFVNKVSARQSTHLADLLDAWEEKKGKLSVVVPEGIDAIRIMTIHKAKGLEFPVVIWPMATEKHKTTFNQIWVDLDDDMLPGLPVALLPLSNMDKVGYSAQSEKEKNSSLLDMINLIYVAFTRPAERLYILSREPANGETANLPQLLTRFIENTISNWDQKESAFVLGQDDNSLRKETKKMPVKNAFSKMISSPWQGRIKIARSAPVYWSADQANTKQAWGTLIHDTLAEIRSIAELQSIVDKQSTLNLLNEAEKTLLTSRVKATIEHEGLSKYFSENVSLKTETGILTPEGAIYRPDRVVLFENESVILEFKTGLPEPKHTKQLTNYADLLSRMGYTNIRKLLVYIEDEITVIEL